MKLIDGNVKRGKVHREAREKGDQIPKSFLDESAIAAKNKLFGDKKAKRKPDSIAANIGYDR
ncbi:hypothetical protein QEN71_25645 [Paraburkholderia sabiae]|uniref:Uncharacterized protein n=1 Tax=Paraburkholderia sabiae TaxID=273251 RepID=A0ABU9QJY7_9BURK|nr:hypothetical protein [Paraburkholderia sabiae]WJZ73486.1 hypothetical protein QEN71_25645 [Paraburkholderia sabiae]